MDFFLKQPQEAFAFMFEGGSSRAYERKRFVTNSSSCSTESLHANVVPLQVSELVNTWPHTRYAACTGTWTPDIPHHRSASDVP